MALFAFVLFAAFLFENDDLIASAVFDDRCFDRAPPPPALSFADEKSVDLNLLSSLCTIVGTRSVSPLSTANCFPPVLIIA